MCTSRPADELAPPWYREKLGCSAANGVARRRVVPSCIFMDGVDFEAASPLRDHRSIEPENSPITSHAAEPSKSTPATSSSSFAPSSACFSWSINGDRMSNGPPRSFSGRVWPPARFCPLRAPLAFPSLRHRPEGPPWRFCSLPPPAAPYGGQ